MFIEGQQADPFGTSLCGASLSTVPTALPVASLCYKMDPFVPILIPAAQEEWTPLGGGEQTLDIP